MSLLAIVIVVYTESLGEMKNWHGFTICWFCQFNIICYSFEELTLTDVKPMCMHAIREYQRGKYHCIIVLFYWFGISCMTIDNFCYYLQNRLIQISQTGG
jgi:hypothetical protein